MSQSGGEAVAEARLTPMPARPSLSMIRSSQSKSNTPWLGSMRDQEKTPRATTLTPALVISLMSSSHVSSGHWSGL